MKCIRRYVQNVPLIILASVWRKLIHFWRRYARKTIFTFSFPVTLMFIPQICSHSYSYPQNYKFLWLSYFEKIESTRRRDGHTYGRTDGAILNAAPRAAQFCSAGQAAGGSAYSRCSDTPRSAEACQLTSRDRLYSQLVACLPCCVRPQSIAALQPESSTSFSLLSPFWRWVTVSAIEGKLSVKLSICGGVRVAVCRVITNTCTERHAKTMRSVI